MSTDHRGAPGNSAKTIVELPALYTPFASGINPAAELVTERGLSWMRAMGLCTREWEGKVIRTDSGRFCSRISPAAPVEPLQLEVDLTYLGFLIDDLWQETDNTKVSAQDATAHSAAFMHALRTGDDSVPDAAPFGPAAADLGRRIRGYGTEPQVRRLMDTLDSWTVGVVWQIAYSHRHTMPDFNTLLAYRTICSGGALVSPWFEMYLSPTRGEVLSADTLDSLSMQAYIRAAWTVATLDNDMVSYFKEERGNRHHGSVLAAHNIVAAVVLLDDVDMVTALHRVAGMRNQLVLRLLRLREHIFATSNDNPDDVVRYLDNYGTMIRGNLDWSAKCHRYSDSTHPEGSVTFVFHELVEPPTDTGPLPYPALRWLWN